MQRCQQHNLLSWEELLQQTNGLIDAAFVSIVTHHKSALHAVYRSSWMSHGLHHLFTLLRPPFAYRHSSQKVVRSYENDDGIYLIAMLVLQLLCLTADMCPLIAAHGIDIRGDVQPVAEETPSLLHV